MSEPIKKRVVLIGNSGVGKSTLLEYFKTGVLPKIPGKSKQTKECEETVIKFQDSENKLLIEVVDTPGLENDERKWWKRIQPYQNCDYVIIMINGTHARTKNLGQVFYLIKSLGGRSDNVKIYATRGFEFQHTEIQYEFLGAKDSLDDNINFGPNPRLVDDKKTGGTKFEPRSVLDQTTYTKLREDIITYLKKPHKPQISLFSPLQLIKRVDELSRQIETFEMDLVKSESIVTNFQKMLNDLLDCVFERTDENRELSGPSRKLHAVSWLPFAGTFHLESYIKRMEKLQEIILRNPVVSDEIFNNIELSPSKRAELERLRVAEGVLSVPTEIKKEEETKGEAKDEKKEEAKVENKTEPKSNNNNNNTSSVPSNNNPDNSFIDEEEDDDEVDVENKLEDNKKEGV